MKYIGFSILAFVTVGCLPIYWALLQGVESSIILFHRSLWTFLTLLPFVLYKYRYKELISHLQKGWPFLIASSVFVAINWLTYIYAINNDHVFEASLAYFISPLISIFLSFLILKERITLRQILAVTLAFLAIIYLLIAKHVFPQYSLIIAISFSFYALLGKKITLDPTMRMWLESLIVTVLLCALQSPLGVFSHFSSCDLTTKTSLIFTGCVTIFPMFFLMTAIKHVPFATIGVLSFILPTVIFLIGIFYLHESFDKDKLITIGTIWLAVALYISDLLFPSRKATQ